MKLFSLFLVSDNELRLNELGQNASSSNGTLGFLWRHESVKYFFVNVNTFIKHKIYHSFLLNWKFNIRPITRQWASPFYSCQRSSLVFWDLARHPLKMRIGLTSIIQFVQQQKNIWSIRDYKIQNLTFLIGPDLI